MQYLFLNLNMIIMIWFRTIYFDQCSSAIYYCALYRYLLHLKQTLCHLCPPASFSSAAYTARSHLGHFDTSGALNGIVTTCKMKRNAFLYYGNKTFVSDFVQKNISKIWKNLALEIKNGWVLSTLNRYHICLRH